MNPSFTCNREEDGKKIVVTIVTTNEKVNEWCTTSRHLDIRETHQNGDMIVGVASFWNDSSPQVHTLAVCVGNQVLVVDLERVKNISPTLKSLFLESNVCGFGLNLQVGKLKSFHGLQFDVLKDLYEHKKAFEASLLNFPDRTVAKVKNGSISREASTFAATEAFVAFDCALKKCKCLVK